jgi:hypothetical protein
MPLEPDNMITRWRNRESYRLLPMGGLIRGGLMVFAAVAATYFLSNVLQARADLREQRAAAAQPNTTPKMRPQFSGSDEPY